MQNNHFLCSWLVKLYFLWHRLFATIFDERHLSNKLVGLLFIMDSNAVKLRNVTEEVPSLNKNSRFYIFSVAEGEITKRWFIKLSAGQMVFTQMNRLAKKYSLPIPVLVAESLWRGHHVVVFDYMEGSHVPSFGRTSDEELSQIVNAIACVNIWAASHPSKMHLMRRPGLPFIQSVSGIEKFGDLVDESSLTAFLHGQVKMLRWAEGLKNVTVNHNDCRAANVFFAENGVFLLDWDSASYGPWGGSLWQMASLPLRRRNQVVRQYVSILHEHGFEVNSDVILKTMCIQYVFWRLRRGIEKEDVTLINSALKMYMRDLNGEFADAVS